MTCALFNCLVQRSTEEGTAQLRLRADWLQITPVFPRRQHDGRADRQQIWSREHAAIELENLARTLRIAEQPVRDLLQRIAVTQAIGPRLRTRPRQAGCPARPPVAGFAISP